MSAWWLGRSRRLREPKVQGFELSLRRGPEGCRDLVVVFSSGRKFAFFRYEFGRDALFVADPKLRYYLRNAGGLARAILGVVDRGSYRRVLFVGSSKGGFGALSIARLCARLRPSRAFHVVAFSPQVRLYPHNPALTFSSYKDLIKHANRSKGLAQTMRRLGDVSGVGETPNLVLELIYARDAGLDRDEAHRIAGPNVRYREVAGATHGTAFHFMCHGLDAEQIRQRIKRAYRRTGDKDLQQTRPADMKALIDEILRSALEEPTLNELCDETLERRPAPVSRMKRLRALARGVLRRASDSIAAMRPSAMSRPETGSWANAFRSHN